VKYIQENEKECLGVLEMPLDEFDRDFCLFCMLRAPRCSGKNKSKEKVVGTWQASWLGGNAIYVFHDLSVLKS
jgi:hypothetical protein